MKPDIWMKWFYRDFRMATNGWRREHRESYRCALEEYYDKGCAGLENEEDFLMRICDCPLTDWAATRGRIFSGWPNFELQQDGNWHHAKIERIYREFVRNYTAKARRNAHLNSLRPDPVEWVAIRNRIFRRDDFTCRYCGERGGELECDHVVPIARKGTNEDSNLVTACRRCNQSKGAKLLKEWRQ